MHRQKLNPIIFKDDYIVKVLDNSSALY